MISLPLVDKPQGIIVYRGPSKINGKPIVVIVTGLNRPSKNAKTGEMLQTYILRDKIHPVVAVQKKQDDAICGDCPHRGRSCYVAINRDPSNVYNAFRSGSYKKVSLLEAAQMIKGKPIRIGTYGDPGAVPIHIWDKLLKYVEGWTGYTHQWRQKKNKCLQRYCMASVENVKDANKARKMGWRTFRIKSNPESHVLRNEFICPASSEANKRLTCVECMACNGGKKEKASVTITVHGQDWKIDKFREQFSD